MSIHRQESRIGDYEPEEARRLLHQQVEQRNSSLSARHEHRPMETTINNQTSRSRNSGRSNKGSHAEDRQTLSSLSSHKGVIIRGLDGKLMHANPDLEEPHKSDNEQQEIAEIRNNAHMLANQISEEEWGEIVGGEASITDVIQKYNRARYLLLMFLVVQLAADCFFTWLQYSNRVPIMAHLQKFYTLMKAPQIEYMFYSLSAVEVGFCLLYYTVGFYAVCKKSIKLLDLFNLICLLGLLSQMMQAYIQRFNPLAFFCRVCTFLYSKYLCDLLVRLVLLLIYR